MNLALFAFAGLVVFMIHEFEEIGFVRRWLATTADQASPTDMWSRHRGSYPSTATIALLVGEEFVVTSILLGVAVVVDRPELILGALICHTLHLAGHGADAVRTRRWTPGSITALGTLLPITTLFIWYALTVDSALWSVLAGTALAAAILFPNLALIGWLSPHVDKLVQRAYAPSP
jgi:hypothetical protein